MIGTLTALQWFIYDSVKVYFRCPRLQSLSAQIPKVGTDWKTPVATVGQYFVPWGNVQILVCRMLTFVER